jgi:hypothetical protein
MAQFWLQRHDMFRELGGMLTQSVAEYREGRLEAQPFAAFFVPRLQFFLQQLTVITRSRICTISRSSCGRGGAETRLRSARQ